jgi:putative Mg2+ transporter-C (MgtC) family protein
MDAFLLNPDLHKLLAAVLVGLTLGAEREYRSKPAGLHTLTLICLGSTIFTMLSIKLGTAVSYDRIAANIVTGVGFLGAGVIFRTENGVSGLTTAAIVWVTAALGMAIGVGNALLALGGAALTMAVLLALGKFERWLENLNQIRRYRIVYAYSPEMFKQYRKVFKKFDLRATRGRQTLSKGTLVSHWTVKGRPEEHEKLIQYLLTNADVKEFDF